MQSSDAIDILLVEDNPADVFVLKKMLSASSLRINSLYTTDKVTEAQKILRSQHFHIALLDLSLPDSSGIDTYLGLKPSAQTIPIIILTGLDDGETALEALKQGAQDYLVKGNINTDLLSRAIQYSLERKKAEVALLVSEEKYKQMFYQNFFPAWIYDPETLQILEVNDAAIEKYGYAREEFLTLTLKDIRPQEDVPRLLKDLRTNHGHFKLWRHKKKNGETLIVEVAFFPVNYLGKVAAQAQINDITEEVKLQRQLTDQQKAERKKITAAVLNALERDREHLGKELHDNINQILATSQLYLEHARIEVDAKDELISKSLDAITLAIQEIRKLSRILVASDIHDIGLKKSIREMISNISSVKKLHILIDMKGFSEAHMNKDLKITIYRIIQEQMTNILKHADASLVNIRLKNEHHQLALEVCDNGKGFDTSLHRKGIGITNIISRVSLYDGDVKIESAPGEGCQLIVTLKMEK